MPQLDLDGANSKISADTIRGQSGTTVTVQSGHNLVGSGSGLTALPAANLTGTLPAIDGSNLTGVGATDIKFLVVQNSDQNGVTGTSNTYNITHSAWTEVFDTGADITNGTFTAPETGKYLLVAFVNWSGVTSSHTLGYGHIVTSNRSYNGFEGDYWQSSATVNRVRWTAIADMDASDTAYLTIQFRGESSNVVNVTAVEFSGALLA